MNHNKGPVICKHTWMNRIAVVLVVCTLASLYGNWRAVNAISAMSASATCTIAPQPQGDADAAE